MVAVIVRSVNTCNGRLLPHDWNGVVLLRTLEPTTKDHSLLANTLCRCLSPNRCHSCLSSSAKCSRLLNFVRDDATLPVYTFILCIHTLISLPGVDEDIQPLENLLPDTSKKSGSDFFLASTCFWPVNMPEWPASIEPTFLYVCDILSRAIRISRKHHGDRGNWEIERSRYRAIRTHLQNC